MTDTPLTVTASMAAQRDNKLRFAMFDVMRRLKAYLRVEPHSADDEMPKHSIQWVTQIDGGPDKVILDANKAHPQLWIHALPDDVCIVPKQALRQVTSPEVIDYLSTMGVAMVETHCGRVRHEAEQVDRERRGR